MLRATTALMTLVPCAPAAQEARAPAEPVPPQTFERLWYDGQAELSGYRWRGARYGELRTGEAVAIFVTEPMGAQEHVKVDRPDDYRGDVLTVLKLNLVRDFQTGIYDYDTMSSTWVGVDDLAPVKLVFSATEWCGSVFEQLDVRPSEIALELHSYFQGESTRATLARKPAAILGDELFVWLRGLRGHPLAPGESRTLPYLADAFERRLRHRDATWGELTVTRAKDSASVQVPAGTFEALVYTLSTTDGRTGSAAIESAYPHHLLRWEWKRATLLPAIIAPGLLTMLARSGVICISTTKA